ncbi:MAG: hypothetical protein OXE99_02545 [Cellvibrionales bacterium]|nr:hypothetical protein [Cellvibrionales bacterium]
MKSVVFLISSVFLLCLLGCERKSLTPFDGQWSRIIDVPKNTQGRCFEEVLSIRDELWQLSVILHSSFLCNQPTLEIHYQGEITQSSHQNNRWTLVIEAIEITSVKNITGSEKVDLPNHGIKRFHEKYVEGQGEIFNQMIEQVSPNVLSANIYPVALTMGIEKHPKPDMQITYQFDQPVQ